MLVFYTLVCEPYFYTPVDCEKHDLGLSVHPVYSEIENKSGFGYFTEEFKVYLISKSFEIICLFLVQTNSSTKSRMVTCLIWHCLHSSFWKSEISQINLGKLLYDLFLVCQNITGPISKGRKQKATIRKSEGDGEISSSHLPNIFFPPRCYLRAVFQRDVWNIFHRYVKHAFWCVRLVWCSLNKDKR